MSFLHAHVLSERRDTEKARRPRRTADGHNHCILSSLRALCLLCASVLESSVACFIALVLCAGWLQANEAELLRKKQDEFWGQADKAANENRLDDALKLCEEFYRVGWDRQDRWYWNQRRIVDLLDRAKRTEDALRAMRIAYDATPDPRAISDSVRRIMQLFRQLDNNNVTRCNAFLDYQMNGPAGADGKLGTEDDLKNPLEAYAYPDCKERARVLDEACAQVSDDSDGSRIRAYACLYTARPKEALRFFVEACQRSRLEQYPICARELVWLGVRPLRGHAVGMSQAFAFITQGTAGADGKVGTEDDLKDPVAGLLDSAPAANAGLPADRVAALKELLGELKALVEDRREPREERRWTIASILRIHEALNDWAQPDVKAWLLDQMALEKEKEGGTQEDFMRGAFIALRSGDWHLGGLNPALSVLEEEYKSHGRLFTRDTQNLRNWYFKHVTQQIWKDRTTPNVKPEPKPKEPKPKK